MFNQNKFTMKKFIRLCFSILILVQGTFLFGQEADSIFSDVEFLGNANNYTEAVDTLWEVFTDSVDMEVVYGIVEDKPVGGNRTSILNERTYGDKGDFYVSAQMKLQKRPSAVAESAWWEDGRLFFAWQNDTNYAIAQFFNTHGPAKDNPIGQGDALGLSGFYFVVDGKGYGFIHSDDPGDPVEEIPAETCIPYDGDTSFYDWNEVKVMLQDSVLSMVVNGVVYHAIGLDTVTMIEYYTGNRLDTIDTIPSAVIDLLFTPGQIGIGSSNDRVYFDDVMAGYVPVEGVFSNVPFFGDAANYDEAAAWLWDVFSDDGEMVYGIVQDKPAGGNRTTIAGDDMKYGGHDYWVEADMKLQKRPSGVAETAWWEDGRLFFAWQNDSNYAWAQFFNTHGPAKDNPIGQTDALGLSGFNFIVDGKGYGFMHSDDPGDPVEEIPAETCIPYDGDTSFYDWNNVKVMMEDSVLSMLVNDEVYHAIGLDTVTMIEFYTGNRLDTIDSIPSEVLDLLFTAGQIGIGSANDRVYFDNVNAGWVTVEGEFSDVEILGDAGNYTEVNPWLWGVTEDSGDTRYGITAPKESGGNRMSILNGNGYDHDWFIEAEAKLFKRASGAPDASLFEDAVLFFSYQDEDNWAQAMYFNHPGIGVTGDPKGQGDAYGISGIRFVFEGQAYRLDKTDDPGDPVEEIPPERCIPFVDDGSFDDWNNIRLERQGTILTMLVNGEEYWALDVDTLTMAQIYGGAVASWQFSHWEEVPQGAKDMLLGAGQIGVGSSNDKVLFDNIEAGYIGVTGLFSDVEILGEAGNYSEINPWLWGVLEDSGDTRYGITAAKESGGNRKSIVTDATYDNDWFIQAEAKLFKRASGAPDASMFEDAVLYFSYTDEDNFAQAMYFNHPGIGVTGDPKGQGDAFGISGIRFEFEGQAYRLDKTDDPGDPVEEIPPERCIPYVDDTSFDDWNIIRLVREGTILRMIVNGEEYWALDVDTLTQAQIYGGDVASWQFSHWEAVPQGAKDMLLGAGKIGIGSSNDKVYFDNVNAGLYTSVEDISGSGMPDVLIYPNPASDMFTIGEIDHIQRIEMYNLSGQQVMEMRTNGEHSVTINASQFESGMYFIQLHSDKGNVAVGKIMIK